MPSKQADVNTNHAIQDSVTRYFLKAASELFFVVNLEGHIITFNTYASEIISPDLAGKDIRDIIVDFTAKFDLVALIKDPSKEYLLNISTATGLPQSFYFTFRPLQNQILVFGRLDAEELESMRAEMVSLNNELNTLTRELHKKNAQLKVLNEEKNRFLGMAAHDLRKPIGLITTYSEFVIDEASHTLDPEHLDFLNIINRSCTFMKRLVDDFLDVSAIEAGKFNLDIQMTDLNDVLTDSLRISMIQADKKGVELKVIKKGDIPQLPIDPSKIEQSITNLVSNAIEYTGLESTVSIALVHDRNRVTFSVSDQGPGIPLDEQQKLFKPYAKISTQKTGGEKSTGLGLLITRKIIEAHGGRLWFDNQPGQGTTVSFTLPRYRELK